MLDHAANAGRAPLSERGDDCYQTPEVAVEALLRVERLPKNIWEPACGRGNIVNVLRAHGHAVIASDLVDYGGNAPIDFCSDFLLERAVPPTIEAIVTNPPYKLAHQFVRHALALCPTVIMLLRLAFYEGERRRDILDQPWAPARIYAFRKRLPMMHREDWQGPRAASAIAFAWFVWRHEYIGRTTIQRISWEDDRDLGNRA